MEVLDVALVEIDLRQRGGDLGVGEHAGGLPLGEEQLDLFELLQFGYRHTESDSLQGLGTCLSHSKGRAKHSPRWCAADTLNSQFA